MYKLEDPKSIQCHANSFSPSVQQLNARFAPNKQDRFSLFDPSNLTETLCEGNFHPAVKELVKELNFQLHWRTETMADDMRKDAVLRKMKPAGGKRQLNPPSTALAMCFHPSLKFAAMSNKWNKDVNIFFNHQQRQDNLKLFRVLVNKVYVSKRAVAPVAPATAASGSAAPPVVKPAEGSFGGLKFMPPAERKVQVVDERLQPVALEDTTAYREVNRWKMDRSQCELLYNNKAGEQVQGLNMRDCWDRISICKEYPLIADAYLVAVGPPHSDVGNERNFSQLGLILTPLRKAHMGVTTMEQSVLLQLAAREGRWTPLPGRASDPSYQHALDVCKLAVPDVLSAAEQAVADEPDVAANNDKIFADGPMEPEVEVDDESDSSEEKADTEAEADAGTS